MISLRDVVTGFGNRDPLAEVWRRDLHIGGSAEITGTLPLRYIGNGKPLTDYMIYGNTVQNGAPSPEAPVNVVGCGELTDEQYVIPIETSEDVLVNNLTSQKYNGLTLTRNVDGSVRVQGTATANSNFCLHNNSHVSYLPAYQIIENGIYYIGGGIEGGKVGTFMLSALYDYEIGGDPSRILRIPYGENIRIDNTNGEYKYLCVYIAVWSGATVDFVCKPYLKAVKAVSNIYLGNVQTTRKIKKLVLTGEENWGYTATGTRNYLSIDDAYVYGNRLTQCYCSHYTCVYNAEPLDNIPNNSIYINSVNNRACFFIKTEEYQSADSFKSYLAAQYEAGTPVTIWYALAEPETAIVNEPLMKIGGYADTISFAQAGVAIPTVSGANVLDMTSPVKPSEVYIKGNGIKPTNDPNFENGG